MKVVVAKRRDDPAFARIESFETNRARREFLFVCELEDLRSSRLDHLDRCHEIGDANVRLQTVELLSSIGKARSKPNGSAREKGEWMERRRRSHGSVGGKVKGVGIDLISELDDDTIA